MNSNKSYKRKRSNSSYKKGQKKYKSYPLSKKREKLIGDATFQKGLIVSNRQMVQLKYVDTTTMELSILSGTSFSVANRYNLNGLYDFNQALGSTAIPGFLEWGGFYGTYRVKGVKIDCEIMSETGGANCGIVMHAQPPDSTFSLNSWLKIREIEGNKYTRKAIIGITDGAAKAKMSMYIDLAELSGNRLAYETDTSYTGPTTSYIGTGANPIKVPLFQIAAYKMDGTNAASTFNACTMDLSFKLYCEFYNRVDSYT